jgi:hypothetical protein
LHLSASASAADQVLQSCFEIELAIRKDLINRSNRLQISAAHGAVATKTASRLSVCGGGMCSRQRQNDYDIRAFRRSFLSRPTAEKPNDRKHSLLCIGRNRPKYRSTK